MKINETRRLQDILDLFYLHTWIDEYREKEYSNRLYRCKINQNFHIKFLYIEENTQIHTSY
jgi:hypothetical protein